MINNSIQQNKNFILKKAGNWADFTLQTIYLVDILLFLHDVLIIMYTVLQFGTCFEPKCSKSSIFYNLMIRLGSTYDSGKNEPLLGKIGARVLNLWLCSKLLSLEHC